MQFHYIVPSPFTALLRTTCLQISGLSNLHMTKMLTVAFPSPKKYIVRSFDKRLTALVLKLCIIQQFKYVKDHLVQQVLK